MKIIFSLLFCLTVFHASSQSKEAWITNKIDSLIGAKAIPGILVGTLSNGIKHYYAGGFAEVSKEQKFDSTTQIEIGSITKTFTAFIVSKVLAEKKIDDTAFIVTFLPDSVKRNHALSQIRFIQLLNHTAGFPKLPNNMGIPANFLQPYVNYNINHLYSYLIKAIPKKDGKVEYSNFGAGLAAVLAERISGKTYDQLLRENIAIPFNMKHTSLVADHSRPISLGYFNSQTAEYWDMNILKGAGAIKSDPMDMLTYLEYFLMHQQDEIVKDITTKTVSINAAIDIAKGWHIVNLPNKPPIDWHNGGTYGFSTFCAFNKKENNAVFIVINAFGKNDIADGLGMKIMAQILSSN